MMKKYIPFLVLTAFALSGCANKEQQENLVVADPQDPIIRETGKPEYSKIKSGVYTQDKYVVNQGDTLFFLSYISGLSAEDIIHLNHLKSPYQLKEGQPILASERGQVVYVGNGLRGYGNLIIIKHGFSTVI